MTAAPTFDDLRWTCALYNAEGRHEEALACAEEAWSRFPERRHMSWWLVAYTHLRRDRPSDAIAAIEAAEAANSLWRTGLLDDDVFEPLRREPRFADLLARAEARIAARGFRARLLVATPEPPAPDAPLLLGLHGAAGVAEDFHGRWLPAVALGCAVASFQSSQPATDSTFCWDDGDVARRDLAALLPDLPAHGDVVLAGFSQGANTALDMALSGEVERVTGVIGVAPSYPSTSGYPEAARPLHVAILHGADDPLAIGIPAAVEALRAAGHRVQVDTVPGLGHGYPDDFAERLPLLLGAAGVRTSRSSELA
jgi:predicted esterase